MREEIRLLTAMVTAWRPRCLGRVMVKRWVVVLALLAALLGGLPAREGPALAISVVTQFGVGVQPNSVTGVPTTFTVTAEDSSSTTITGYTGTVHFTSSDGSAVLPADSTLTNGSGTFSVTFHTVGSQTVTATDTVTSSITGTGSSNVTGPATHFTVIEASNATAGAAFNVTIIAQDSGGNQVTSYGGTVHFTSSDGSAVLPADSTLTNGNGTFSITLKTAGNQTVTATDTMTSSITGNSGTIAVAAAAATHFTVSAPASTTAGTAVSVQVVALDQFGNTATSYGGTVHFTSSDGSAVLPADSTLTSGNGTFSITLKTAGNQTVTATDSSITGTSGTIAVAAAAAHFVVTAPPGATAGLAVSVHVVAQDQFGNTNTGYNGTVHFTSSDGAAVLPADSTLTNGNSTFSITLKTAGNQTVTATDTGNPTITGAGGPINVLPATATHFVVSTPSSVVAGSSFNFTVTAEDQFGNTVSSYGSSVGFTSSDGAAGLPSTSMLTNGVGVFNAVLRTFGNQTLTATSTVLPTITGASGAVSVAPPASQPVATATFIPSATPTMTATPSPTAPSLSAATATSSPTSVSPTVTSTPPPTLTPTQTPAPILVIHNNPRTVVGGRSKACDLAGNTRGAREPGCEIVSSASAAGATVTYMLSYLDGSTQRFIDTADSRGHSLHPFNVAYQPPAHKGKKGTRVVARIMVEAVLPDGATIGPLFVRFAVIR